MQTTINRWIFSIALLIAGLPDAWSVDNFVLVQNGERIGTLQATSTGLRTDIVWRVDDNGRGPKLKETVLLGADGLPQRWSIEGKAWFGAPVRETFQRGGKSARWTSLNDQGKSDDLGAIYLPNESSPWGFGLYLQRLLQAPDQRVRTLPSGELRLDRIREHELPTANGNRKIVLFALWGLDFTPTYLVAGSDNEFLGFIAPGFVYIASDLEKQFQALSDLADTLDVDYLGQLTQRLTHRFDQPVWLRNVRVFDSVAGRSGAPTNVVIHGDRIVGIRDDQPPADAVIVEGEGGTLLPGLHDMHSHSSAWGGPLHLAAGVTTVRDMGNNNATLQSLSARTASGQFLGPHISKRGFLEGRSPFSARGGFVVDQLELALEKVRWYADHGYGGIKVYNSMTPAWVKPIAAEARRLGLKVSGHVPAFMTPTQALLDGYDEINHINQLMLGFVLAAGEDTRTTLRFTAFGERVGRIDLSSPEVEKVVALMRERDIALDPTLELTWSLLMSRPGQIAPPDRGWLEHVPAPMQRARRVSFLDIKPAQVPVYEDTWRNVQALLLKLHRAGVRILPGTDDFAGLALHSELEAYVTSGLTPAEALQAATIVSARHLGNEAHSGSIALGKRADLLLVDGDPTRDIRDLRKVRMTVKAGQVFFPTDIFSAIGFKPFSSNPVLRRPQANKIETGK